MPVSAVLLGILLIPIALVMVLRRTKLWWLPGAGLCAGGTAALMTLGPPSKGGVAGIGAWNDLSNVMQTAFGVGLLIYGFVLLLFAYGRSERRPTDERSPVQPPKPTVEGDQSASSSRNAK